MATSIINKIPFFADLGIEDTLAIMGCMKQVSYSRGENIFLEGDAADNLYIIDQGTVNIYKGGGNRATTILATLNPGDFFGEMGLLDGLPRSASAQVATDCRLMRLSGRDFEIAIKISPHIARNVMRSLAMRIRKNNK